jgi:hypothetical protein
VYTVIVKVACHQPLNWEISRPANCLEWQVHTFAPVCTVRSWAPAIGSRWRGPFGEITPLPYFDSLRRPPLTIQYAFRNIQAYWRKREICKDTCRRLALMNKVVGHIRVCERWSEALCVEPVHYWKHTGVCVCVCVCVRARACVCVKIVALLSVPFQ